MSVAILNDTRPKPLKQADQVRLFSSKLYTCNGEETHRITWVVITDPLILHGHTVFFNLYQLAKTLSLQSKFEQK